MVVTVGGSCYALGRVLKIVRTSNMDSQGKQTVPRPSARAGSAVGKISLAVTHRREPWPAVCPGSQLGCPKTSLAEASGLQSLSLSLWAEEALGGLILGSADTAGPEFESWLCPLLVVGPWGKEITFLHPFLCLEDRDTGSLWPCCEVD